MFLIKLFHEDTTFQLLMTTRKKFQTGMRGDQLLHSCLALQYASPLSLHRTGQETRTTLSFCSVHFSDFEYK